jgi:hypothetical protein
MKTYKTGDTRGRPRWRSSFVGDPGATFSGGRRGTNAKQEEYPFYEEKHCEVFLLLLFLLLLFLPSGTIRSGAQRSGARRSLARRKRTLDGEGSCKSIGAGGKDLFSGMQDMCHHGGSKDG